jgi:hypothetical protein
LYVWNLHPFVPLFGPYTYLKIFLSHTLNASSICLDIVHPSQPYFTIGPIIADCLYVTKYVLGRHLRT